LKVPTAKGNDHAPPQSLAFVIAHDKASVQFFDGPGHKKEACLGAFLQRIVVSSLPSVRLGSARK